MLPPPAPAAAFAEEGGALIAARRRRGEDDDHEGEEGKEEEEGVARDGGGRKARACVGDVRSGHPCRAALAMETAPCMKHCRASNRDVRLVPELTHHSSESRLPGKEWTAHSNGVPEAAAGPRTSRDDDQHLCFHV